MVLKTIKSFAYYLFDIAKKLLNGTSLRRKLLFTYFVVVLIPIIYTGYNLVNKANDIIIAQTQKNVRISVQQMSTNIANQLNTYESLANFLYFNSRINNYLNKSYATPIEQLDAYDYIREHLVGYINQRNDLRRITIYYTNKELFNSGIYMIYGGDWIKKSPLYDKIMGSNYKGYWAVTRNVPNNLGYLETTVRGDNFHGERIFTYNRVMNFNKSAIGGILSLEIREEQLYKLIEEESKDKTILLADENGCVITSNLRSSIGKSIVNRNYYPEVAGTGKGEAIWRDAGDDYLIIHNSIYNGWKIIALVPLDNILGQTYTMRKFGFLFIFLSTLAAFGIIYIITGVLVKRLGVLLRKINHLKEGNMEVVEHIDGNDEVTALDRNFNEMAHRINKLIHEVYILTIEKKEAELIALQAQINPHFLYNTLSSISWTADKYGSNEIKEVVESLSRFYRISLSRGKEIITVGEEIECIKAYLNIQSYRMKGRIGVTYTIDDAILEAKTLKLILQPLVENSIEHGMGENKRELSIRINGRLEGDSVILEVIDDGEGMSRELVDRLMSGIIESKNGSGYGFKNVDRRIKLYFGEQYGLSVSSSPGMGTSIKISLPFQ